MPWSRARCRDPNASTVSFEYFRPLQRQSFTLMTRKQWVLIALAVVLGGFALYLNRDWFADDVIQIQSRSRPGRAVPSRRGRPATQPETDPVFFLFEPKLKLTSLKVIPIHEIETNKYPHPIYYLVSDSNSVPIAEWSYAWPIRGMRPAVKGATPDPLEPGVAYRLIIEAGKRKAERDFVPKPRTP